MSTSNRDDRKLENTVKQSLGRASQGVNWSWSQCIKSHRAQTSSGKGLPSHFWNIIRSILPGRRRKITVPLFSQWSKVLFSDKSKFCISFVNQGPRVWKKSGEAQNPCCLKSSVKFPQSVKIWYVICWCWSTVFSEVHSQCSHLPGNCRALHAYFFWQVLWRCCFNSPAGLGTCPHCQRYQQLVQWPWCYFGIENLWGIVKRKMRHQTQQCRWPEGRYQGGINARASRGWSPGAYTRKGAHWLQGNYIFWIIIYMGVCSRDNSIL